MIEPSDDAIIVVEFIGDIFFLHEEDEGFKDAIYINLQIVVLFIDQFLEFFSDIANLEEFLPIVIFL